VKIKLNILKNKGDKMVIVIILFIIGIIGAFFVEKLVDKRNWNDGICRSCKSVLSLHNDLNNIYKCTCCGKKIKL
jgi:hypothetical protein